jgi:signal transduction histidine kinase
MQHTLIITHGDEKGVEIPLENGTYHIGRNAQCEISTPNDTRASRKHAAIQVTGQGCKLSDLNSRNGTRVNGHTIDSHLLHNNDVVVVGNTKFKYISSGPDGAQQTPSAIFEDEPAESTNTFTFNTTKLFDDWVSPEAHEDRATKDLEALYLAAQTINALLDTEELLPQILDIIFTVIPGLERCSIFERIGESEDFRCLAFKSRSGDEDAHKVAFSRTMVNLVFKDKQAILTCNAMKDARFNKGQSIVDYNIQSAICAPLQTQSKIFGFIQANTVNLRYQLDEHHMKLLSSLGLQAGIALENARLYGELQAEKQSLIEANEELRLTQDKMVAQERMAAVGSMAAGVIHDIKNPVAVIEGYHDLLVKAQAKTPDGNIDTDRFELCLNGIGEGLENTKMVIKNLLDVSKPQATNKKEESLNTLLHETIIFLKSAIGKDSVTVEQEFDEGLPLVMLDISQLKRVFSNIIMNGIQALEDDKTMVVRTATIERDGTGYAAAFIRDHGSGMPEEVKKHIFEPFFTTKDPETTTDGGTGIGLSVCYNLVKGHNGFIEVESQPGEGTEFIIGLPLVSV